ncbi:MAG: tetratricopeptide repeat protein [Cytophagales bacterium]
MNSNQNVINQLVQYAQSNHQKGNLALAINTYKEALKIAPQQVEVLHLLGVALCSQKAFDKGIVYLEKALAIEKNHPQILVNTAFAYHNNNQSELAIPLLKKLIEISPKNDDAWFKLGLAYRHISDFPKAIDAYENAIAINSGHANALNNLGNIMLMFGKYKTAITYFENCLSINYQHPLCHNNLGIALLEWDRFEEAEKHYLAAIAIDPKCKEALKNIVQLYEKQGKEKEANQFLSQLIAIENSTVYLEMYQQNKAPIIAISNKSIDEYRSNLYSNIERWKKNAAGFTFSELHKNSIYPSSELIYQGRENRELKEKFASLFASFSSVKINQDKTKSKPAIGFVVTKGHEGVFLKCMKGLLQQIDKQKFAIVLVCSLPNGPEIFRTVAEESGIEILALPDLIADAVSIVADANFDILYYWEIGTDATNYFLALSKPAKVQITSWGWPITSGLKTVDYFISNKNLETYDSVNDYTEKLVLFEKMPVYYYPPPVPKHKTEAPLFLAIAHPDHRYICQQNLRKVHPDFDELVQKILIADKEAYVFFINDTHKSISNKLQDRLLKNIGNELMQRVVFLERMPEELYLNTLTHCTLALDTLHYGGGANTVYDAMEASLPTITLAGNKHSARFATATYLQMGISDGIAQTLDEYVEKVLFYSKNIEERNNLADKIKKHKSLIFEDKEAVNEWEGFFESILNKK